ncbi:hypothetical protein AB0B01_20870 [Streptomyces sp. NPDC044571]|uniref:hypothetical protein n=1 Tax=Streptomyces sp. NPDC044571 TaxID=3155371 RepID=UPI0033DABD4D
MEGLAQAAPPPPPPPGAGGDTAWSAELPPATGPEPPATAAPDPGPRNEPVAIGGAEAGAQGIPATVLAAYRQAEQRVGASDPHCGLRRQLLAAIGKVESDQAAGGRVDAAGTTLRPIRGPVLDGRGFATVKDTDGGAYDGDAVYDRAVGPMQDHALADADADAEPDAHGSALTLTERYGRADAYAVPPADPQSGPEHPAEPARVPRPDADAEAAAATVAATVAEPYAKPVVERFSSRSRIATVPPP